MINLVPETHTAPPAARRRYIRRSLAMLAVFLVVVVLHGAAAGAWPQAEQALHLGLAVLAGAFLFAGAWELAALVRSLDELQQRVHLIAMALGYGGTFLLVVWWGMVSVLTGWPALNPAVAIVLGVSAHYIALFFTARRLS